MKVKCNKCGYIGDESEFPKGRDFFQHSYIAKCPKCDNYQTPGDASMRMFGGDRPFEFVRVPEPPIAGSETIDALPAVLHRASEAS
jgi:predicted nucleic-acid-binding Zn-ribbon protein